jgi:hypothetical protein
LHHSGIDRVAQVDGVEAATRIHVHHGRKAGVEIGLGVGERDQRTLRRCSAARVDVNMAVDHAGKDVHRAQVDHACPGGNLCVRSDRADTVALDRYQLIVEHLAGACIKQMPGPDDDDLILRRDIFSRVLRRGRATGQLPNRDREHNDCWALETHIIPPSARPRRCGRGRSIQ